MRARLAAVVLAGIGLTGCDPRDCWLGIASGDCPADTLAAFPQDDAICREYGLSPGTRDYDICREKKAEVRTQTEQSTERGFVQGPFLPDPR